MQQESFTDFFILEFTKEILRNTESYKDITIEREFKKIVRKSPQKKEGVKDIVRKKLKDEEKRIKDIQVQEERGIRGRPFQGGMPFFNVPNFSLPRTVSQYRPTQTHFELDLGKLNPILRDNSVKGVECEGPEKKLLVDGFRGKKHTGTTLSKEEIDEIINKFSMASRIPLEEGLMKIAFGKLMITTIISETDEPKFIITKIPSGPQRLFPFPRA